MSRIGGGGMGVVWRARDEVLDRQVALKEVLTPPGLSGPDRETVNRRAIREARSAARLSHPGVVTVFDVVEDDRRPWVVMELVNAPSLQEVITSQGPLSPRRVAHIGRQMLASLGAAHAVGILHRDVKPGNVLLTNDDRAILTDFGIAFVEGEATLTPYGGILGSPSYIAPERLRGERAFPASDLWALGVTLFTALVGHPPFQGTDPVAVFGAVLAEDPVIPEAAGSLRPVLEGLLRKDPAARMSSGVADALLLAVLEPPIEVATQPDVPPSDGRFVRLAGAAAYVGAGLMALGTVAVLTAGQDAALDVLALTAPANLLMALGLYLRSDRKRPAKAAAGLGVVAALALPGAVVAAPGSALFAVLWCGTGLWLGFAGLGVAPRSRPVALAGESAVAPWILLISVPTLAPGARLAVLTAALITYGCWATGAGRLLSSRGDPDRGVRSSRGRGPWGRLRSG